MLNPSYSKNTCSHTVFIQVEQTHYMTHAVVTYNANMYMDGPHDITPFNKLHTTGIIVVSSSLGGQQLMTVDVKLPYSLIIKRIRLCLHRKKTSA